MKLRKYPILISLTLISLLSWTLFANVCKFREKTNVKGITTKVILDNRRPLKDGRFPLKLRWTCNRKSKYIGLEESMTELDFYKIKSSQRPRAKSLREKRLRIEYIEKRAREIAEINTGDCDFEKFKAMFLDRPLRSDTRYIKFWIEEKVRSLGNPNTSEIYENTLRLLDDYKPQAMLEDVTPVWLENFKLWMSRRGLSQNSIAIHFRNLRHCYRNAQFEGHVETLQYPFDARRFRIPSSRNVKKALSMKEITLVYNYQPAAAVLENGWEVLARDLWRFLYLTNGMNPVDAAGLLYSNIKGDMVSFNRAKTMGKTKHIRPVSSVLHPDALQVIQKWGQKPATPNTYIFGVLSHGLTAEQKRVNVKNWTRQINKYLKRIQQELGIETKLTTMTARHSHATVLMNSGAPTEFIKRSLGHASTQTTQNYLDDFEIKNQREYLSALTNWS